MVDPWTVLLCAGLSLAFSAALTYWLSRPNAPFAVLDHPNERSLHEQPVPRTGGLGIAAGLGAGAVAAVAAADVAVAGLSWLVGAALVLAVISLADDQRGVPVAVRFSAHLLAALALMYGGFVLSGPVLPGLAWSLPFWVTAVVSLLFIVWMINLYNFMDGMDGFAGGMAVIGFGALAAFGWLEGNGAYWLASMIVAASALGFLIFNLPPARIFMGDTGSAVLGFVAAAFILWGARAQVVPLWAGVLVFSPFIVDASVTLIRRLLHGERVWKAHRIHYYQRLVRSGWGHGRTLVAELILMPACAGSALAATRFPPAVQWAVIAGWVVAYLVLAVLADRRAPYRKY